MLHRYFDMGDIPVSDAYGYLDAQILKQILLGHSCDITKKKNNVTQRYRDMKEMHPRLRS